MHSADCTWGNLSSNIVETMDTVTQNSGVAKRAVQVILVILGIVGIYYLYKYLFAPAGATNASLISGSVPAAVSPSSPIIVATSSLVPIYEGGTFTVSTWLYINNWSYRQGMNKHILSIGGNTFDTIRVYLGANKSQLHVRLQTKELGAVPSGNVASSAPSATATSASIPAPVATAAAAVQQSNATANATDLAASNASQVFGTLQTDSGLLDFLEICDLPELDLQRWVNVTISVDGRTCDVYMDGKLVRSCVLKSFYKVDVGYQATLLAYGGFGGNIATTTLYDNPLNPADIYKIYEAGPVSSSFMSNITSLL